MPFFLSDSAQRAQWFFLSDCLCRLHDTKTFVRRKIRCRRIYCIGFSRCSQGNLVAIKHVNKKRIELTRQVLLELKHVSVSLCWSLSQRCSNHTRLFTFVQAFNHWEIFLFKRNPWKTTGLSIVESWRLTGRLHFKSKSDKPATESWRSSIASVLWRVCSNNRASTLELSPVVWRQGWFVDDFECRTTLRALTENDWANKLPDLGWKRLRFSPTISSEVYIWAKVIFLLMKWHQVCPEVGWTIMIANLPTWAYSKLFNNLLSLLF